MVLMQLELGSIQRSHLHGEGVGGGGGGRDGVSGMGSFKLTEEASLVDLKGLVRITLAAIQGV